MIHRLNDNNWLSNCIQVEVPFLDPPEAMHKLASEAIALAKSGSTQSIDGRWKIVRQNPTAGFWSRIYQYFPMTRMYPDRDILQYRVAGLFSPLLSKENPSLRINIDHPLFSDPYTILSELALQTKERYFVEERKMQGSTRLVLSKNGFLQIEELLPCRKEENRRTVATYKAFAVQQYGQEFVDYAQYAYGFNFGAMIDAGEPLLPDHVFKTNIGVNNIEMRHLEILYGKLLRLQRDLRILKPSREELLEIFSVRELRGFDLKTLDHFLKDAPALVEDLSPASFNWLVQILMPNKEELDRAMTGRKITHLAICGFKTMGNLHENDPARDQFELLQIFSDLQKPDWANFYELLAHVVAKKSLFREYPKDGLVSLWKTGVLIPAPQTSKGDARWYYSKTIEDNGKGNLNYLFMPACAKYKENGRPLPMIHAYRSTNSSPCEIDAAGSVENDFYIEGSPGVWEESSAEEVNRYAFFTRTIPLWVAYLLHADTQTGDAAEASYRKALEEFGQDRSLKSSSQIREYLLAEGERLKELPKYKIAQDLLFSGHSLGAALAQVGIHHFGPGRRRIPCPGSNLLCRAYNGPATDTSIDRAFMNFGREHRDLLDALGQRWKIFHQLEYGDIVPEVGGSHLGTNGYDPALDEKWLEMEIQIFRPTEAPKALPITTCATHGRRIGGAVRDVDYTVSTLSPQSFALFDHAWVLGGSLRELFGYRVLISPRIVEIARRILGFIFAPLLYAWAWLYNTTNQERITRDEKGIFSCVYRPTKVVEETLTMVELQMS